MRATGQGKSEGNIHALDVGALIGRLCTETGCCTESKRTALDNNFAALPWFARISRLYDRELIIGVSIDQLRDTFMTLTSKRILFGTITFGLILLLFQFQLPVEATMTTVGIAGVLFGLLSLVIALLAKRGKLQPDSWWGRSAAEIFWPGIGILVLGLGQLSHLIVASDLALKLRIVAALVFTAAIFVGRGRAKVAEKSKTHVTPVA